MSQSGKRSGTICGYLPFLRTACICTNDDNHKLEGKAGKKKGKGNKVPINWYTFYSTDCRDCQTFTKKLATLVFPSAETDAMFDIYTFAKVTGVVESSN